MRSLAGRVRGSSPVRDSEHVACYVLVEVDDETALGGDAGSGGERLAALGEPKGAVRLSFELDDAIPVGWFDVADACAADRGAGQRLESVETLCRVADGVSTA